MGQLTKGNSMSAGNRYCQFPASTLKGLYAAPTASGNFDGFANPDLTKYQVPTGFKLVILGIFAAALGASASVGRLGYGDTTISNAVGPPTNAKTGEVRFMCPILANTPNQYEIYLEIPAGKFPYILSDANGPGCWFICAEVPA